MSLAQLTWSSYLGWLESG